MIGRIARSRAAVAVVASALTAMVVGGFALAAIPNGNTIHACRNKTTFVLRVIDKSLGQACSSSETALSWSSWRWRGPYSPTSSYAVGDVVRQSGSSYLAKGPANPPVGAAPTNTTYWALVVAKGDPGPVGPQGAPGSLSCDDEQRIKSAAPSFVLSPECPPPVPLPDPVARWTFDDQNAVTADVVGPHDAQVNGATFTRTNIAPVAGNVASLEFDGIDDYLQAADPGAPNDLDGFAGLTLSAWIRPSTVTVSNVCGCQMVISKYNTTIGGVSYWLLLRGDEIEIEIDGILEYRSTSVNLTPGTWVHIAGTWNGPTSSTATLYVNGEAVAAAYALGPGVGPMRQTAVPVNIGAAESIAGARGAFFQGTMDDARIYSTALTASEVAAISA